MEHIINQMIPVRISTFCFQDPFLYLFLCMPRSFKWYFAIRFPNHNFLRISLLF